MKLAEEIMSLRMMVRCLSALLILAAGPVAGPAAGQEEKREVYVRWRQGPRGWADASYRLGGARFKSIEVDDRPEGFGHLVGEGQLRLQVTAGYHSHSYLDDLDILMFTVEIRNYSSMTVHFSPLFTHVSVQPDQPDDGQLPIQLPVLDHRRLLSLPGIRRALVGYLGAVRFVDDPRIKIPPGGVDKFGMFFAAPERKGQKLLLRVSMVDQAFALFEFPWP
jgi:hypothetical protein